MSPTNFSRRNLDICQFCKIIPTRKKVAHIYLKLTSAAEIFLAVVEISEKAEKIFLFRARTNNKFVTEHLFFPP